MPSHYNYYYKGIKFDPYRIALVYGITNPAQQQALKKILRAGKGMKDVDQDIDETIVALERWKEMIEEDSRISTDKKEQLDTLRREVKAQFRKALGDEGPGNLLKNETAK